MNPFEQQLGTLKFFKKSTVRIKNVPKILVADRREDYDQIPCVH
jgi:hypothetical protein